MRRTADSASSSGCSARITAAEIGSPRAQAAAMPWTCSETHPRGPSPWRPSDSESGSARGDPLVSEEGGTGIALLPHLAGVLARWARGPPRNGEAAGEIVEDPPHA